MRSMGLGIRSTYFYQTFLSFMHFIHHLSPFGLFNLFARCVFNFYVFPNFAASFPDFNARESVV